MLYGKSPVSCYSTTAIYRSSGFLQCTYIHTNTFAKMDDGGILLAGSLIPVVGTARSGLVLFGVGSWSRSTPWRFRTASRTRSGSSGTLLVFDDANSSAVDFGVVQFLDGVLHVAITSEFHHSFVRDLFVGVGVGDL